MMMEPSFGQCLKAYRKRRDLTQEKLAELVNCASESIRKMEADRQRPSRYLAELIAEKLELPAEERCAFVQLARAHRETSLPVDQATPSHHDVNGLPSQLTSLVGRMKEIAVTCALLRDANVRLLTLTGPGGVGKTRLAMQVATELIGNYPDGVYFIDLTPLNKPSQVLARISRVLRIQETGERLLLRHIQAHLHNKHLLMILDNFEHVLPAAPHLARLLEVTPGLCILVTSRETLHLYGEHEFAVPPLAVPDSKHLPSYDQLTQYDAVRIFVERARAVKFDFEISESNAWAIVEICRKLDGLPLAIELAAAHSKLLSPAVILSRLEDRFKFLASQAINLPERHQALHNTIDWSYDLLNSAEQTLFRRLSVFVGGCTLEATQAVCVDAEISSEEVQTGMASLVDKSLLQQAPGPDCECWVTMLETVRAYALEQLASSGESEVIRQRHLNYYLDIARNNMPHSIGMNRWGHLERLEMEHGNLRAATQWAIDQGQGEAVVKICGSLVYFWYVFGQPNEIHQWLEDALNLDLDPSTRAQALGLTGYVLAFMQIDYQNAESYYQQALDLWRELKDAENTSDILCQMGNLMMERGEYDRAQALHGESLSIRERTGDQDGVIGIRECLGVVLLRQGELERAGQIFQESLSWWQSRDEPQAATFALNYLGVIAFYQQEYDQAHLLLERALEIWQTAGDTRGVSAVLNALGPVALQKGQVEQAKSFLKQSLRLRWECQDYDGIAWNLERLAEVALAQNQLDRAARLWGVAEGLRKSLNSPLFPIERLRYEQPFAAARAQLGESTWALVHYAGQTMPIEQAVAYALQS